MPALSFMVVRCNTVVTVLRPAGADDATDLSPGLHEYDGRTDANDAAILRDWPASVLAGGRTEASREDLPADVALKGVTILLPAWLGLNIATRMRVTDAERAWTVSGAELTALGWRLSASLSDG